MALHGTKALEKWCKIVTQSYDNLSIVNMTTSWRSGLGFCAIIHHFRPELIDFEALDPDDVYHNNELAFKVAEQHLGIPALLDPHDMVACELLDRLSILTYLSQFYQAFHGATTGAAKPKRNPSSRSSSETSSPAKTPVRVVPGRRNEPCKVCGKPVFILERLNVGGKLLHRTCFKCARCNTQLSLANYYETEQGAYCCDMCPDEELNQNQVVEANKKIVETHLDSDSNESEAVGGGDEDSAPESLQKSESLLQKTDTGVSNNNDVTPADINDNDTTSRLYPSLPIEAIVPPSVSAVEDETTPLPECDQHKRSENANDNQEEISEADESMNESVTQSSEVITEPNEEVKEEKDEEVKETKEDVSDKVTGAVEVTETDDAVNVAKAVEEEKVTETDVVAEVSEDKGDGPDKPIQESEERPSEPTEPPPEPPVSQPDETLSEIVESEERDGEEEQQYPGDLNPFGDEDDAFDDAKDLEEKKAKNDEANAMKKESTNPFGSDFEDDDDETPLSPQGTPLNGPPKPPRASLNPFGSDFEDDDDRPSPSPTPSSAPSVRARKKRPAPRPPSVASPHKDLPVPAPRRSLGRSHSPSPSVGSTGSYQKRPAPPRPPPPSAELHKQRKDRDNHNRRSQQLMETSSQSSETSSLMSASNTTAVPSIVLTPLSPDKGSIDGLWKRKKGPAPARPIPAKRQVKKLPRKAVNQELYDIEIKQQELERQGVKLEKTIRDLCEKSDAEREEAGLDNNDRDSLGPGAEDLIVQLFDLVDEKNELFRRQTELMYMKKEHRLEEEHADLEHKIRILMSKPDCQRTEDDKKLEERLIGRLVTVVANRNEIVDCLEMDRLRELEEDESIEIHMGEFAAVKVDEHALKKKKKKKKEKEKKKKHEKYDADKDIDTSEQHSPKPSPKKDKDKAKKLKKKILATLTPHVSMKKS